MLGGFRKGESAERRKNQTNNLSKAQLDPTRLRTVNAPNDDERKRQEHESNNAVTSGRKIRKSTGISTCNVRWIVLD